MMLDVLLFWYSLCCVWLLALAGRLERTSKERRRCGCRTKRVLAILRRPKRASRKKCG